MRRAIATLWHHIERNHDVTPAPAGPGLPIERQIGLDASPVMLVNVFMLDKADEQAFLEAWRPDAEFMKRQPGFVST